mmetsp:Transcript_21026/g.58230  ORF Transcript_21026/g.58230 Transcript_21026/m.58230 type:complete len:203 (+) Transcript_21026:760-1368(+)
MATVQFDFISINTTILLVPHPFRIRRAPHRGRLRNALHAASAVRSPRPLQTSRVELVGPRWRGRCVHPAARPARPPRPIVDQSTRVDALFGAFPSPAPTTIRIVREGASNQCLFAEQTLLLSSGHFGTVARDGTALARHVLFERQQPQQHYHQRQQRQPQQRQYYGFLYQSWQIDALSISTPLATHEFGDWLWQAPAVAHPV